MKVMGLMLVLCTLVLRGDDAALAIGRAVWVEPAQHDTEVAMADELQKWGRWKIVGEEKEADLLVRLRVSGNSVWGRGKVQVFIIDARSRKTVYTSRVQTGNRTIFHGWISPYSRAISGIVKRMREDLG